MKEKEYRRIGVLAIILAIAIFGLIAINVDSIISLSERIINEGQEIVISIDTSQIIAEQYILTIESDTSKYISPITGNLLRFIPPAPGEYRVLLKRKDSSQEIEAESFIVKPIEKQLEDKKEVNTIGGLLYTDKHVYKLGESVAIYTTISREEWSMIRIILDDKEYTYTGSSTSTVFKPTLPGSYKVEVLDSRNNVLAATNFTVLAKATEDIKETQPVEIEIRPIHIEITQEPELGEVERIVSIALGRKGEIVERDISIKAKTMSGELPLRVYEYINGSKKKTILIPRNLRDIKAIIPEEEITNESLELKIDKPNIDNIRIGLDPRNAFIIDSNISARIIIKARGKELWKCKVFNNYTCISGWEKVMDLIPGREYVLPITPGDPLFVETGLATINSEKPFYRQGEKATTFIVTLDKYGYRVDANLSGVLVDPNGLTIRLSNNDFKKEELGVYNYSFIPSTLGTYQLIINATGENINTTINGTIRVVNSYEFEIERSRVLVIDPWRQDIEMRINITPLIKVDNYTVIEQLPLDLEIIDTNGRILETN
ncbi:hypothetical protein J7K74_03050, partial [Candidatus Woesearchaeota archaeon]|nr:hypothetical protein [Candidatus Woesearchaeota archaeon]